MFANALKLLRKKKGLSQKELAKELSFAQSTIAMWETEKNQPDYETLQKLANFFNVSVDYLIGNTDEIKSEEPKQNENKKAENKYSFTIIGHGGKKGIIQLTPEQIKELDGFFDDDNKH